MPKMSDYISIQTFATMFCISVKTAKRWINKKPELFEGQTIRRNQTLYIGSGAIDEFEQMGYKEANS